MKKKTISVIRKILILVFVLLANQSKAQTQYDFLKIQYDSLMSVNNKSAALKITKQMNQWALENEGDTSLNYAVSFRYMGNCFDNNDSSLFYYNQSRYILENQKRNNCMDYSRVLNNFGNSYFNSKNYSLAIIYLSNSLEITKKNIGEINVDYLRTSSLLGQTYFAFKEYEKAKKIFVNVSQIREVFIGTKNYIYSQDVFSVGRCEYMLGNYEKAKYCFITVLNTICNLNDIVSKAKYLETLIELAKTNRNLDDHKNELKNYIEATEIMKQFALDNEPEYLEIIKTIANLYLKSQEVDSAKYYYDEFIIRSGLKFGIFSSHYLINKYNVAIDFYNNKYYDNSLIIFNEILFSNLDFNSISEVYFYSNYYTGIIYNNIGKYHEAINNLKFDNELLSKSIKKKEDRIPLKIAILKELGYAYLKLDNKDSSLYFYTECLNYIQNECNEQKYEEACCLEQIGIIQNLQYKHIYAITSFSKAILNYENMRLKFVSKNQTYFQYRQKINELYNFILEIQLKLGNQSKAIIIVNNITDLYQNGELIINDQVKPVIITSNLLFENYITQYADSLLKIVDENFKFTLNDSNIFYNYIGMKANIAISKHNYSDAMKSLILIAENYKIINQKDRIELGFTYSRIGGLYANVGDLDSSLYYINKSNQIYFEDNVHFNNYRKLIVYNYLEMCTKNLLHSNFEAADSLINILSDKKYNDDIQYDRNIQTKFLLTKGNVCLKINKLEQLNEIITEIKSNLQNDSKLKQSYYPNYLELFANYSLKTKNWIEANKALINLENIYTTSNNIYGLMNVYIKQNNIYFEDKDFELMKNNFNKGKNLVQEIAKLKEYDHNTYMELSYFLSSLGYSIYFGDTSYANIMIRIIDNYKIITDYPEFLESYYYDLMLFYVLIDNPNYFKKYYQKELSLTIEKINKLIAFYPINEQSKILNIENSKRNDLKYFLIKNKLYEELYNDQIHFKSFTLENNSILRKEIGKLNDDTLTKKYKTLQDDNVNLLKLYPCNNVVKISEIQKRIQENYKYLKANCIKCNDLQNKVDINYLAIQSMLLNDNAAIEFIRYYDKEVEVYKYNALVIKKKGKLPISVYLCKESELLEYFSTKSLSLLYDLVWEPIDSLLQGVENVYYSPDGLLYSVPFHALCMNDSVGCSYLMDKYNLHQLSTTRYLADSTLVNTKPLNNTINLYGGINYDAVNDTSSINHEESNEDFILGNNLKRETTFNAVSYLPGTKQEVESVVPLFNKNKWNTTIATGSQASEQLFKSYSDTLAPSIIHIATHGFAFPDIEESKMKNKMDMLMLTNNQQQYTAAEDPMMRCGLMFAGANKSWTGKQKEMIEQTGQDGILTAAEVANMDLSNTKLVVLSACETGLGKVEGSEGVFGLQRGFKLAGVEQLIVSLWKVPDRETMELMNLFYTDLTITKDPVVSFSKAQKQMRNNYPDNPEKWAGFVLVR